MIDVALLKHLLPLVPLAAAHAPSSAPELRVSRQPQQRDHQYHQEDSHWASPSLAPSKSPNRLQHRKAGKSLTWLET